MSTAVDIIVVVQIIIVRIVRIVVVVVVVDGASGASGRGWTTDGHAAHGRDGVGKGASMC